MEAYMKKSWHRILPWIALSSGILVILLLGLATILKPSKTIEGTINKKIALNKLKQIRIESTENINSKAFFDYCDKSLNGSVINTKWLVSRTGEIIYAKGMMSQSTPLHSSIYSCEDAQSHGLINAVESNFDSVQKGVMFMAARIRCEGEHNDILGHLVMPLKTSSNVLVGYVGVAYLLDDSKPPIENYNVIIIALIFCFFSYWLLIPLWVYFDCREKNNKYILWTIFVLFGNIPALIAYLISNRK
jgi:hypothetical protein